MHGGRKGPNPYTILFYSILVHLKMASPSWKTKNDFFYLKEYVSDKMFKITA